MTTSALPDSTISIAICSAWEWLHFNTVQAGRQAGRQAGAKLVLQRPSAQQAKRILLCLPSSQGHLCHYACPLRSWHRRPVAGIQHLCSGGGTERRRGIVSPLLPNF